jgi:L,D-peptidoglycan transpeptidase YkuD (ErfK/YbiS/YcfS/YnhG family)
LRPAGKRREIVGCKPRLFLLCGSLFLIAAAGTWIALTWNSWPGGYLKNRLFPDAQRTERAKEAGKDFLARHPEAASGSPSLLVSKSKRQITLFVDDKQVWTAPIGLGGCPEGHKQREGDQRTPEGDYYVCTRNPKSRFHLFLGLSYPGIPDARRGLSEGAITQAEHDRIVAAIESGKCPPWKTALGGEVGIHGSGSSRDWTLGCVALDDPDIELLWALCPLGTPVRIEP